MAKRYSAGTIFLQVSPVFRRFQEEVQDYVKDIDRALGDDMEKSGERAGQRAGKAMGKAMASEYEGHFESSIKRFVKNAEKEIGRLDLSTASEKMLRDLDEAKKKLRDLRDQDFNVDFNSKEVIRDLGKVQTAVEALTEGDHDINVDTNISKVLAEVKAALKYIDKEVARKHQLNIDVMTGDAERKMGAFEKKIKATMKRAAEHIDNSANAKVRELHKELERLGKLKVGIDISGTRLQAEAAQIMRELRTIADNDLEIDARFDAGRAYAELKAFDTALNHVDGRTVRVKAVANTANAQRGLFGLQQSGEDAANSFRSFNIILLAAAGAGPALIPILGAIAGGLLAIGPAAAVAVAGLSSVLIGFSGIGDALTALQARDDARAQTVAQVGKSAQAAARAEADGARRVADARRAAASQVESALDAQADAQERYRDSVEAVREAEIALAQARKAARGTGADIKEKISDNARAQDQALLDVFNATVANNAVQSDGSATNAEKEQSRINLEAARDALDDLRKEGKKLAAEQKKWRKEGVNGTDEVKSAQDNLNDALEAQKDAYQDLRDASEAVEQARADGARAVADAMRESQRATNDAADAMGALTAQQANVDAAFDKLGPAGKKFALFLYGLREGFRDFRDDIQTVLLPQIQTAIEGFLGSGNASVLRKALINLADSFGAVARAMSVSFQGEAWGGFFKMLADLGPDIQEAYGQAFISFMEAMASILTTLAPYALEFAEGFAAMMESFAGWAASKEGADGIERFMDHMKEIGPDVLKFFGVLALALTNIVIALAPYAELILGILTGFLDMIANMDTKILGDILVSILVLVTASQIAYAVMNLMLAGTALLGSAIGRLVFTTVGLALAIYYLWTEGGTLGKVVAVVAGAIYGLVLAMKIWRATAALVAAVQVGLAAASYGAAGATYAQAGAARAAYLAARIFAATQWLVVAAMNGTLLAMVRTNAVVAASIARIYAMAAAQKVAAAATAVWNAVMNANPLLRVITILFALGAAMVWAYKKFDGFRKIVDTVVNFVKDAFFDLWDFLFGHSVMPDIIDGMEWFFDRLSEIFGWIKTEILEPIARVFQWLWSNVIKPVLGFIIAYYKFVFKAMKAVWTNVLWPVFKTIGKVVWALWKVYFKVVFTLIKAYFKAVFWAMKQVWEKVLHPVFKVIGKVVGWLWKNVFQPTLGWIGNKFGDVFRGMKLVWDNVLKPVFDFIGEKALPKLKGAFETAVDGIKKVWNGLKKVVAAPIRFVLDTVINKGLIAGFNKVAGWVNMDGFDPIDIPQSLQSYATGGVMPGYTPGRDPHKFYSPTGGRLELSGGEAVMRPEWTAAMGPEYVHTMNAIARSKGTTGVRKAMGLGGYWMGGILPFPGASVSSHGNMYGHPAFDLNYPGYSDYGQRVGAWKAGKVAQMNYIGDASYGRWAVINHSDNQSSLYAHLSAFAEGLKTGMRVAAGQWIGNVGDLGNTGNPPTSHLHFEIMGGNVDYGDTETGGRSVPGFIKDLLLNPIKTVKGWATSQFDKASDFIVDTPVWDVMKNVPAKLAVGFGEKAWDMMPGWAKSTVGAVGDFAGAVKDGAGAVVGGVKDGIGAGLDAIGLAEGGILPYNGTMMYDNGGYLPPGLTTVVNLTGKPEPVFTDGQWSEMSGGGAGGGNIHYEPHFEGSDLTAADVAGDLNFTFRKIKRGGRYEGVGR